MTGRNLVVAMAFFLVQGLAGLASANDLQNGTTASLQYSSIAIEAFHSATAVVTWTAATPTSSGNYSGYAEVEVTVEGNICGADPATVGVTYRHDSGKRYLGLTVSSPLTLGSCLMYSRSTKMKFRVPLYIFERPGTPIDQSLGIISTYDMVTGDLVEKDLRFQAENGQFSIVVK